jgi:hypothetical protein
MSERSPLGRARRIVVVVVSVIVLLAAGRFFALRNPKTAEISVSQQTTYLTTPTRADGWVDYPEAVDWMRRAALGVDGKNAAAPLVHALGSTLLPTGVDKDKLLQQLGVPAAPADAPKLVRLSDFEAVDGTSPPEPSPEADDWLRARCAGAQARSLSRARIADWIAKSEAPLADVVTASRAASLYVPVPREQSAAVEGFARVNPMRLASASEALRCRAALRLLAGDAAGSWADLEAMWKLGLLVARSASLGEYALAGVFWRDAMGGTVDLAASSAAKPELLASVRKTFDALPAFPPATETLMLQRLAVLNAFATPLVAKAAPDAPQGTLVAKAGTAVVMEGINQRYDALDAVLQIADPRARIARIDQVEAEAVQAAQKEKAFWTRLVRKVKGEVPAEATAEFGGQLAVLSRATLGVELTAVSGRRLATIALAIAKFQREKGSLPASLTELGDVPKDPASGGAFAYKPSGRLFTLYGVGRDGRDDGGDLAQDMVAMSQEPPRAPR